MIGPSRYQFAILAGLQSRPIYGGTVPPAVVKRRRAANKVARRSRRGQPGAAMNPAEALERLGQALERLGQALERLDEVHVALLATLGDAFECAADALRPDGDDSRGRALYGVGVAPAADARTVEADDSAGGLILPPRASSGCLTSGSGEVGPAGGRSASHPAGTTDLAFEVRQRARLRRGERQ